MNDWPPSFPIRVSALPSSPKDSDEIYFIADSSNGVLWHLRYNAGSGSSYKWESVGSPPLISSVATDESTASATYAALATAGPSVVLPLAGDYEISLGRYCWNTSINAGCFMSYDIGGTGAVDADTAYHENPTTAGVTVVSVFTQVKTGLTAVTLTSKYRVTAGTGHFKNRWIRALPIRVG